jgi:hypothetical protein
MVSRSILASQPANHSQGEDTPVDTPTMSRLATRHQRVASGSAWKPCEQRTWFDLHTKIQRPLGIRSSGMCPSPSLLSTKAQPFGGKPIVIPGVLQQYHPFYFHIHNVSNDFKIFLLAEVTKQRRHHNLALPREAANSHSSGCALC